MIDLRMLLVGILLGAAIVVNVVSRFDKEDQSGCFYRLLLVLLLTPAFLLVVLGSY